MNTALLGLLGILILVGIFVMVPPDYGPRSKVKRRKPMYEAFIPPGWDWDENEEV